MRDDHVETLIAII